jgi:hypothetical protein
MSLPTPILAALPPSASPVIMRLPSNSFAFYRLRTLPKIGHQEFPAKSFLINRFRTLAENMGVGGVLVFLTNSFVHSSASPPNPRPLSAFLSHRLQTLHGNSFRIRSLQKHPGVGRARRCFGVVPPPPPQLPVRKFVAPPPLQRAKGSLPPRTLRGK